MITAKSHPPRCSYPRHVVISPEQKAEIATDLREIVELLANHPAVPLEIEMCCHLTSKTRRHRMAMLIDAGIVETYKPTCGRELKGYKLTSAAKTGAVNVDEVIRRLWG